MGNINCFGINEEDYVDDVPRVLSQDPPQAKPQKTADKAALLSTEKSHPPLSTVENVETNDGFNILVRMPLVKKLDIDLEIAHKELTLKATCEWTAVAGHDKENSQHSRKETFEGTVHRIFTAREETDLEKITAKFENKVLTISLPNVVDSGHPINIIPVQCIEAPPPPNMVNLPSHSTMTSSEDMYKYEHKITYKGFHANDIKIEVQDRNIEIFANKNHEILEKTNISSSHSSEHQQKFEGTITHHITVDLDGDPRYITAIFSNSVLTVTIQKIFDSVSPKVRKIFVH